MGMDGSKALISFLFWGIQLFSIIGQKWNSNLKKNANLLIYDDTFL